MLAQTLQDLVVVPDGRGLILTRSKVALQLKGGEKSNKPESETDQGEGGSSAGLEKAAEKTGQVMYS